MQPYLLPPFSLLIITSLAFVHIPKSFCQDQQYATCGKPFPCGNLSFSYPFWGGDRPSSCGYPGFNVSCQSSVAFLAFLPLTYRVLDINVSQQSVTVARDDLWGGLCTRFNHNTSFNSSIFSYSSGYQNLSLSYGCTIISPNASRILNQSNCIANSTASRLGIKPTDVACNTTILVPVNQKATQNLGSSDALKVALNGGFGLQWKADNRNCELCSQSGGRCGYNSNTSSFVCYCSDRPYDITCNSTKNGNGTFNAPPSGLSDRKILALGISFGTIGLLLTVAGMYFLVKKFSSFEGMIWSKPDKENNQHVEAFIRNCGSIAPKCYSFSEIKRMTDSFAHRLGQGGYGFVYKGKLSDGREVAVKVLRDNKGNGDEFMNEVASISRTSHVNVVSLLGFCYKANKRALVYEFMSNGSLDKFIYKGEPQDADCRLEWKVLYQIAVGTARGLEYLHQGCNTRIVHFDIKPHNILLDKDFCPKISDFGLAKLCKKKESVLSTMGARGTVGYIAPEVFFRGLGGISHKSDVYSYGMMALEMVGLKSKIQVDTEKISETYLPNWIHERLALEQDLGFEGVMNAEDEETARKMLLVGLWCIQTKPSDRPSMSKVVEMLEGSIQSLQIPPKPNLLDSPTAVRSFQESPAASLS